MFKATFRLCDQMIIHSYAQFSLFGLISKCGGLFAFIFKFMGLIVRRINRNFLLHKIISATYFVRMKKDQFESFNVDKKLDDKQIKDMIQAVDQSIDKK